MTGGDVGGAAAPPGWVAVGRLGRTHGLGGSLRLHLEAAAALSAGDEVHVAGHGLLRLRLVHPHGAAVLVAFQGVRSPERAQALVNAEVRLPGERVPEGAEAALVGAEVVVDGAPIGRVARAVHAGQLLLLVRTPGGERWLPGDAPYVHRSPGRIELVDPPAGLLDDEA